MADAISVTLGGMAERARALVATGRYASMSEVVRAGLRALDREEDALVAHHRALVQAAIDDPRPRVPRAEAMARICQDAFGDG
jgi:antitoxin ParD1/3/4